MKACEQDRYFSFLQCPWIPQSRERGQHVNYLGYDTGLRMAEK